MSRLIAELPRAARNWKELAIATETAVVKKQGTAKKETPVFSFIR